MDPLSPDASDGIQYAEVSVEFLATDKGGRASPVHLDDQRYRPHIRIQGEAEYLGVEFVDGPDRPVMPGESTHATVRLTFWPQVDYSGLIAGSRFEILEGSKVVGAGKVVRR